jgi:tellurite methyltransferase
MSRKASKAEATPTPPAPGPHRRATLSADYQRDWPTYFDAAEGKPARATLALALDRFDAEANSADASPERRALDIACGSGRDTLEILARSRARWRVWAVDAEADGLRRLRAKLHPTIEPRVTTLQTTMESLAERADLPDQFDLVNASFALPFCDPAAFPALWDWIIQRLPAGGRFAGQFFGDRDEWAPIRPASHHTRDAVVNHWLKPFTLEHLEEIDRTGDDAMGGTKHHHLFHIVARKR